MPPEDPSDTYEEVTIGGETFLVSEIRMGTVFQIQRFLNKLPRPAIPKQDFSGVAGALTPPPESLEGLAPEARIRLAETAIRESSRLVAGQLREAREEAESWPPEFGSASSVNALMAADGGVVELLFGILKQRNEGLTRPKVEALLDRMTTRQFNAVMDTALNGARSDGAAGPDPTTAAPAAGGGPPTGNSTAPSASGTPAGPTTPSTG